MSHTPAIQTLSPFLSQKFRFWAFVSMVLLVFVHGYTIEPRYLQPWTQPEEAMGVVSYTQYLLSNGLLRFRIPMLFAISGFLFALHDAQPHGERMKNRVRTLLVPYFFWSGFHLVLLYLMETDPTMRDWVSNSGIAQMGPQSMAVHDYAWNEVLIRWLLAPVPYQLWFIRVLFIYNLAYPLLAHWINGRIARRVFFAVAVLAWWSSTGLFFIEGEGLLFFALGIWMQKTGFNIATPNRWLRPVPWALVAVSAAAFKTWLAFMGHTLLIGEAVFPLMGNLHKLTVFSGLVAAWYGSDGLVRWCMARPWFVWLSAFSFMIYALHAPLVAVLIGPTLRLFAPLPEPALWVYLLLPLALIAVAIALGAVLRRFAPAVYAVATGGRGLGT
ncbi:MAG: acyltransferase [Rhodoferax sp.]|nr:acyltransferase [Rhodoferax sp.]